MTEKLTASKILSLEYLEVQNCIRIQWLDYPGSKEFRAGMDAMLEAMKKHNTAKILSAEGKLGAVSEEDQKWVYTDWTPRCAELGVTKTAIILSDDIFNQISVENMVNQSAELAEESTTQYFKNEKEALDWLSL